MVFMPVLVDKILYFAPIKSEFFGAFAVRCLPGLIRMARYQSEVL
jgi:hypothetical protein